MSNSYGVTYTANGPVQLTPGSLVDNGTTYDIAAAAAAAAAMAAALAAQATANAAQTTANNALPKTGGTMTGDINMSGTQKVTNLAAPTIGGDATNKTYVDNLVTGVLRFKGSTDCSGNPNYPAAVKGDAYVVSVAGKIGGAAGIVVEVGDVFFALADNAGGTQAAVGGSWDVLQYNLNGVLLAINNLSDVQNVATARTNLGLGTAATYSATTFAQVANNLSDLANASTARTNLGLGTSATYADTAFAKTANNLNDLTNAGTARTNLGLGSAATYAATAFAQTANNLSDLANAGTARTNLGLGSVATLTADTDGTLAANSDSNVATQKATKTYADTKVAKTGGTMTGLLTQQYGIDLDAVDNPPNTGTLAMSAGGSVTVGTHYYAFTYYTAVGETKMAWTNGFASINVTAGNQTVTISGLPTPADSRVIGRKIYRTKAGSTNYYDNLWLIATIANNVDTTYVDTAADAASGTTAAFRENTTNTLITVDGYRALYVGASSISSTMLGYNAGAGIFTGTSTGGEHTLLGSGTVAIGAATKTVVIGNNASAADSSVAIGHGASNQSAGGVSIGRNAGINAGGSYNIAIGQNALAVASAISANYNIGIGYYIGTKLGGGAWNNILIGGAGTAITNITTGSGNIIIGAWCDVPTLAGSKQLNIGCVIFGTGLYNSTTFTTQSTPTSDGKIGIGVNAPTARLHLAAGAAGANLGPLKFTSGTSLTTPEAGTMEYNGTLSFTNGAAVRKDVALKTTYTPTLTPAAIGAAGYTEQTFTVTGLTTDDTVIVNGPAAAASTVLVHARVSAADTLALTWITSAAATPTSGTYRIVAIRS